ncbi:ABC transporter [Frigoribacterium salinisoli]
MKSRPTLLLPAAAAVLALAGCASGPAGDADPAASETAVPHGYVEGASEQQEPQLRLVTLDDSGALHAFDPVAEESRELADLAGDDVSRLATDGRYLFASSEDGVLRIVDGGAWTVPHGDHNHYYLADAREVGEVDGGSGAGPAEVASSATVTAAWFPGSGTGVLLDAEALADGEVAELGRVEGPEGAGVLAPLGDLVVASDATGGGAADGLRVLTAEGDVVDGATASCPDLRGAASTRVGIVVGCSDGAVLATQDDSGEVSFEQVPYPAGTAAADVATAFEGRPGRPTAAAVAGSTGAWLFDARAREWTLITTPEPLLRASAVGDSDGTVVGVDASGRVVVLDPTGVVAQTEPLLADDLVDGALPDGVELEIDVSRSYVNSPSAGVVHEIDHGDAARVARTLDVEGDAARFVETGR